VSNVYILLGSNLGDQLSNLQEACSFLKSNSIKVIASSLIYQTKAWGNTNQDDFLNVVLKVDTKLSASLLLETLLKIELQMGRVRGELQWMPRLIDIDILYFNDEIVQLPHLKIPHPYIAERRFTLIPLNDIAPDFIHPQLNVSNKTLLQQCEDKTEVVKTNLKLNF
jgi:2-amino-4-hydroxy-6-hydroxymethyldihydropteridine diphosphokinase